jgi:hypothetical protein
MPRRRLSCPLPLRERAQWCAHTLEWVRGSRGIPLTLPRTQHHRAALSRKGRGRCNTHRARACIRKSHDVKQPISFPRRVFCARALPLCFAHPQSRDGRSAERRSGVCETPVGHAMTRRVRRLARRLASHDAGRSPLGAPPWRFWASGAALLSPNTRLRQSFGRHPDRSQRAPRSQVLVPGGRGPCLPRRRLQAAAAGRHSPLRLQDVSGDAPQRARMRIFSIGSICSQECSCGVVTKNWLGPGCRGVSRGRPATRSLPRPPAVPGLAPLGRRSLSNPRECLPAR